MKMNFVYILLCSDNTYYTGWTTNIENRLKAHNNKKGAKYTKSRLPVKMVYFEPFDTKTDALKREAEIKKLTRANKEKLIKEREKSNA